MFDIICHIVLIKCYRFIDINSIGAEGSTPLQIAVKYNALESVKMLLDHQACTTITNSHGDSALHTSCRLGNYDICEVHYR